ncbi:MAG: hypothetical protein AAF802_14525, partial [Planctomycetota bacterium]
MMMMSCIRSLLAVLVALLFLASTSIGQARISESQFDSWVYGQMRSESNARKRLLSQIEMEIRKLDQFVSLDAEQKYRIRLAGSGDIQRFLDDVADARDQFKNIDATQINEAWQVAQPLQQRLQTGLFGQSSLLNKTYRGLLTDEQAGENSERTAEQSRRLASTYVSLFVAETGRRVHLDRSQRERLTKLFIDQLEGENLSSWQYSMYL